MARSSWASTGPDCRRSWLLLDLTLQFPEVLSGDVHPVLLGLERRGELDVTLPVGDGFLGIDLLVDEGDVVERAGVRVVHLDHALVLVHRLLVQALLLVDLAEPHPRLDELRVELDRLLVGVDGLVVEPLLRVVDLAEAQIDLGVDRVEHERLLVAANGRVGPTFRARPAPRPAWASAKEGSSPDAVVVR